MRTVSVVKEGLLVLASSAAAAVLLLVCVQEIIRPPGVQDATLGRLLPITSNKSPWLLLIAVVLLAVWFGARAVGKDLDNFLNRRAAGVEMGETLGPHPTNLARLHLTPLTAIHFKDATMSGAFQPGADEVTVQFRPRGDYVGYRAFGDGDGAVLVKPETAHALSPGRHARPQDHAR